MVRDAAQTVCVTDFDCRDGVFCNGVERCMPGASGASPFGCVPPAGASCLALQRCEESTARCRADCGRAPDADGDGHRAAECGGDDCDDADANRFPGNPEVCDPSHDEDCVLTTVGTRDQDHDGEDSIACCNTPPGTTAPSCGTDCDDARADVRSRGSEVCNGIDDNCDGRIDEGLAVRTYFPDCDGDGFGVAVGPMSSCAPPAAAPVCSLPSSVAAWSASGDDCDDADDGIHVGASEVCDGVDNNCDGRVDEQPAATRACGIAPNATLQCAAGACSVATCATTGMYADCDHIAGNGCEVDLATAQRNCGACGNVCPTGTTCATGLCVPFTCPTNTHACGGTCVVSDSVDHCGGNCSPCAAPPSNGRAACVSGRCDLQCDAGYVAIRGAYCVPGPVLTLPLSGSLVGNTSPLFEFLCPASATAVTVQVCADRTCGPTSVQQSWAASCPVSQPVGQTSPPMPLTRGPHFWRLTTGAGTAPTPPVQEFFVRDGPITAAPNALGITQLDVNANGLIDAVVAAPGAAGMRGGVYVHLGLPAGLSPTASLEIHAPDGEPSFGTSVARAGDLNGDGYGDVAVAAPDSDLGSGRVYVYYGGDAGLDAMHPTVLSPVDGTLHFGVQIAGGGDLDGDGYADLAISDDGHVYVYLGRPEGILPTPDVSPLIDPVEIASGPPFGPMALGDGNNDGLSDLMFAHPMPSVTGGYSSALFVVSGRRGLRGAPMPGYRRETVIGTATGQSVAFVGDLNGDGNGDFAVGASSLDALSRRVPEVRVYLGNTEFAFMPFQSFSWVGAPGSTFGEALGAAGDINGDGYDDLVVATPGASQLVWVLGRSDLEAVPPTVASGAITVGVAGDHTGVSFTGVGDIDRDMHADILVGADLAMTSGRAYVLPGGAAGLGTSPITTLMCGDPAVTNFGRALARVDRSCARRACGTGG